VNRHVFITIKTFWDNLHGSKIRRDVSWLQILKFAPYYQF